MWVVKARSECVAEVTPTWSIPAVAAASTSVFPWRTSTVVSVPKGVVTANSEAPAMNRSETEFGYRVVLQRVRGADVAVHGARIGPPALPHDLAVAGSAEGRLGREAGA